MDTNFCGPVLSTHPVGGFGAPSTGAAGVSSLSLALDTTAREPSVGTWSATS